MELILLTTVLSLANILGTQAVTSQMPQFQDKQYPVGYEEQIARSEKPEAGSLLEAVINFKKEKGWI